jgi:hypothetical protein
MSRYLAVSILAAQIAVLACGGQAHAQAGGPAAAGPSGPGLSPAVLAELREVPPPMAFRETWKQPPYTGRLTDPKRRVSQAAVGNPDLQLQVYGTDAQDLEVYNHYGQFDLWTGLVTSPVAVTLRDQHAYLDLTGLAALRARTRTEDLHVLHPVVRLADGTLLAGSQTLSSPQPVLGGGDFVVSEVTFNAQRWFVLDPQKLVVTQEVKAPDLSRVDAVGFVDLMPSGGHGFSGCSNVSWMELYANTHQR